MDPKKTRVLWKGLFGKNKSLKSIALESRNRAEKQLLPQEETSAFSKSSRKGRQRAREAEESAEALRRQQEAEQEQELQKRVRKYFNLNESGRL